MKRYLSLIPILARRRRKQSRMTRLCIFLAVFLVTAIFGMADMELRSQRQQAILDGGNWQIAFRDITDEQAAKIAARPEVEASSWYGVLNYDSNEGYTLSGIETAIAGVDAAWWEIFPSARLEEGAFPAEGDGVLLTQGARTRLGIQVGDAVQLHTPDGRDLDLTVTGFVSNTAMLDRQDALGMIMNIEAFRAYFSDTAAQDADSVYYVQFSPLCRILQVTEDIKTELHLHDEQALPYGKLLGLLGQSDDPLMLQLYLTAAVLALLVAAAGVLMIASSLNSNIAQRTSFFGLLRCLGATRKQVIRFVRLEALNWCKTAVPLGLAAGTALVWALCALLVKLSPTYFAGMPSFGISGIGVACGAVIGLATVLLAAQAPARRASKVSPLCALSGNALPVQAVRRAANTRLYRVETALGFRHATAGKKGFFLMAGSFAFSIILFLAFTMARPVDCQRGPDVHHPIRMGAPARGEPGGQAGIWADVRLRRPGGNRRAGGDGGPDLLRGTPVRLGGGLSIGGFGRRSHEWERPPRGLRWGDCAALRQHRLRGLWDRNANASRCGRPVRLSVSK